MVTSDHGEALGDHGELTHGLFAYEPTLAVPLVIWGHGVEPGRDARPAGHVDLFPTVLDAVGLPIPEGLPGTSLLSAAGDGGSTYFEALSANLNRGWAPLRGLIQDGRKVIALPLPELYDLSRDPAEANNLIRDERSTARALLAALPKESVWPPARQDVSPEMAERLRSLGYLSDSGARPQNYGPDDDPKNLAALDRTMHRVIELYSQRELTQAVELARSVVAQRPAMPMGRSLLAQALLEKGETDEALAVMRQAREEGLASDALLRQLGLTLAANGAGKEAVEVLLPLAEAKDPRSSNALALALTEIGRHKEAQAILEETLEGDPDNPKAHEQLGLVALRQGLWKPARDHSRRALELNERLPLAWNNLGVALYQLTDWGGALDAWQRASALGPRAFRRSLPTWGRRRWSTAARSRREQPWSNSSPGHREHATAPSCDRPESCSVGWRGPEAHEPCPWKPSRHPLLPGPDRAALASRRRPCSLALRPRWMRQPGRGA